MDADASFGARWAAFARVMRPSQGMLIDRPQAGEPPEVLSGGGEEKFVAGSVGTPEAQAGKAQDALEMSEQHLDLLPTATASAYSGVAASARAMSRASSSNISPAGSFGRHRLGNIAP